jgi:hypothetical protein
VIKWLWMQLVKNKFQGGARSFDDQFREMLYENRFFPVLMREPGQALLRC